ncbi:hypothetical protein [Streptomyces endophytica]|uniref:hypothetical protein n=1 Tax=Streptomyces endophytica TaxID=2991496 RepID=UPI003C6FBA89
MSPGGGETSSGQGEISPDEGETSSDQGETPSDTEEAPSDDEELAPDGEEGDSDSEEAESENRVGLTPRQARRIRIVLASVLMATMAVVLVVRLASRTSVLVVGVYGAALVLCGVVIELSRHGRTRLGTWLLGIGLAAALAADWLLLP